MKIRKYIMVLVLVSLFMGASYADDNVKNSASSSKSKIVYGSFDNANEIRQKDIDALTKAWNSPKIIKLVWVLYDILNDNEEYPDKATFIEMVKKQNETWITIGYLDWLGISKETLEKIKKNAYLVEWLWIKWKTSSEKLQAATAANQAEWKWEDIKAANQAEWKWKDIKAANQAATKELKEINNIALWH